MDYRTSISRNSQPVEKTNRDIDFLVLIALEIAPADFEILAVETVDSF